MNFKGTYIDDRYVEKRDSKQRDRSSELLKQLEMYDQQDEISLF